MPPGRRMPFSSSLRHALTSFVLDLRTTTQQLPTLCFWRQATLALLLLSSNGTALHCSMIRKYSTTNYPKISIRICVNSDFYIRTVCDLSGPLHRFQNEETSQHAGTSPSLLGSTSTVFSPPLPEVPQVQHAETNHETGKVNATKKHFWLEKYIKTKMPVWYVLYIGMIGIKTILPFKLFQHIWLFHSTLGQCADLKENVFDLNICWGLLDSWQGTTPPSSLRTARSRVDRHASKFTWESVKPREESSSMIAKAKNAHKRKKDRDR